MNYDFKVKPYPHQVRALRFLLSTNEEKPVPSGGLYIKMRFGKTKVSVDAANCLHLKYGIQRVLVVCPVSGIGVWESEIEKNTPDHIKLDWRIVNYEMVFSRIPTGNGREWVPGPNKELRKFAADLVIVDESHRAGKPTTTQSRHIYKLAKLARYKIILTGTFFHRGPLFVHGQMKLLDESVFGGAWGPFKEHYADFGGASGKEIKRYRNLKEMSRKLKPWIYHEKPPEGVAHVHNTLPVHLDGRNLTYYEQMERESIINVDGNEIKSDIALTTHLRLQMITGGWVKTKEGKFRRVGDCKFRIVKDRLREYIEEDIQHAVIGCRFLPELRDVAVAGKAVGYLPLLFHGGLGKGDRDDIIRRFQTSKRPTLFIAQVSAGKESIDLSVANTLLWYSLPESYVDFDQFGARIQKYDEKRTLLYDYLIARGTRDEVTLEALKVKKDVVRFLMEDPEHVERITAKR